MDTQMKDVAELPGSEYDANGLPAGITVEEWFDKLDRKLIGHFGEEYRKLANERRSRWNRRGAWQFKQL